jgi:leucyl aminopeptidase
VTDISLSVAEVSKVRADAVVLGLARDADGKPVLAGAPGVDAALRRRVLPTLVALGATGKAGEVHRLATFGATAAPVLVAVGLGPAPRGRQQFDTEVIRRGAGAAVRSLAGTRRVAIALPPATGDDPADGGVRAIAEGALLGGYEYLRYRTASRADHPEPVASIAILTAEPRSKPARAALVRAQVVCRAVCAARDLVNTPPSDLHPREFAEFAAAEAKRLNLDIEILDERALKRGRYGGILGVGQGSVNPPRLVRIAHRHRRATTTLALVGKGITFDSGGLSLKPSASMEWMKSDMGGAAAVVTAVAAIAELGLAVNVTGWAPLAENMPSGSAQRPSDVLTIYGGKTVEVLNTDAEGRLVLADALVRASEEQPDLIVDAATLTGAQLVALGTRTSAVMANDDELRSQVLDAAERAGEQLWPMPLPPELRKSLDSPVADIANMGESFGGMLVAGTFLKDFVGERDGKQIPWAHLDIAGPAFNQSEPYGYTPKGGTGAAVRTFVQLAEDLAAARS